jgi:RimJ/RimL family protein N-acetyltransferase/uncharacterized protein YhfF
MSAAPLLETARLRLRELVEDDTPALFSLYSDEETMRFWSCPAYREPAQALGLIRSIHQGQWKGELVEWGVESREESRLVGTLTLHQQDPGNRRAELGFLLGRPWWGRGLMRDAAGAALTHAFAADGMSLHRVEADTDPRNFAAIRLLERLGFVREGLLRQRWLVSGEWSDSAFYGLLSEDWAGDREGSRRMDRVGGQPVRVQPMVSDVVAALKARGVTLPPGPVRVDSYGDSAALSMELLALIRQGAKRAGTGLLWAMDVDGEAPSRVGDIEIVLDHNQEPALVTRITWVQTLPFSHVTADYAAREGEGDGSLEYWRRAHWAFFSRECARIGREPSGDMPVVCSVFEVLEDLAGIPPAGTGPTTGGRE